MEDLDKLCEEPQTSPDVNYSQAHVNLNQSIMSVVAEEQDFHVAVPSVIQLEEKVVEVAGGGE